MNPSSVDPDQQRDHDRDGADADLPLHDPRHEQVVFDELLRPRVDRHHQRRLRRHRPAQQDGGHCCQDGADHRNHFADRRQSGPARRSTARRSARSRSWPTTPMIAASSSCPPSQAPTLTVTARATRSAWRRLRGLDKAQEERVHRRGFQQQVEGQDDDRHHRAKDADDALQRAEEAGDGQAWRLQVHEQVAPGPALLDQVALDQCALRVGPRIPAGSRPVAGSGR